MKQDKKRIIDSVHGNIYIDREYVANVIDTPEFQRLRRIEQTSTRAIFPSARHDRFIHSIGVYYMGSLIAAQIDDIAVDQNYWGIGKGNYEKIRDAYHIACLLHDVGHAPFSHTFEEFYGENKDLSEILYSLLPQNGQQLRKDLDPQISHPKPHEFASAILTFTVKDFRDFIRGKALDQELIARMIIGCKYNDDADIAIQIKNCFINLLNGEVIDADRLDYACRDVWASGYSTSSIDMKRLISGLFIKSKDGKLIVCFSSNVLNEIESVLDIKEFQVKYILNHHTVVYEQNLLKEAAKQMAINYAHYQKLEQELVGSKELEKLEEKGKWDYIFKKIMSSVISLETISRDGRETNGNLHLRLLADDDLIFLMKQEKNELFEEWESRQYTRFALWKTRDEFFALFPQLDKDISFTDNITNEIMNALNDNGYDALVILRTFSSRLSLKDLNICIGNSKNEDENGLEVLTYNQLYRGQVREPDKKFPFVYIKKGDFMNDMEALKIYKANIIHLLSEVVMNNYVFNDREKLPTQLLKDSLESLSSIDIKALGDGNQQKIESAIRKIQLSIEKIS